VEAKVGEEVQKEITIINNDDSKINDMILQGTLSREFDVLQFASDNGVCERSGLNIGCRFANIGAGKQVKVILRGQYMDAGTFVSSFAVELGEGLDPNPDNNQASFQLNIVDDRNTWYVAKFGDDNAAGTVFAPYASIKKAYDSASSGDVIKVAEGVYEDNLTLAKDQISLKGGYRANRGNAVKLEFDGSTESAGFYKGYYLEPSIDPKDFYTFSGSIKPIKISSGAEIELCTQYWNNSFKNVGITCSGPLPLRETDSWGTYEVTDKNIPSDADYARSYVKFRGEASSIYFDEASYVKEGQDQNLFGDMGDFESEETLQRWHGWFTWCSQNGNNGNDSQYCGSGYNSAESLTPEITEVGWDRNIGKYKTSIEGANKNYSSTSKPAPVLTVKSSDVVLEGLWINNLGLQKKSVNGGVFVNGAENLTMRRNIIHNIGAVEDTTSGSGLSVSHSSDIQIDNNTIVSNAATGVYFNNTQNISIEDSIVTGNNTWGVYRSSGNGEVKYSNVWGNGSNYENITPGEGTISEDPLFANTENYNSSLYLQLLSASPCLGTGTRGVDMGALPFVGEMELVGNIEIPNQPRSYKVEEVITSEEYEKLKEEKQGSSSQKSGESSEKEGKNKARLSANMGIEDKNAIKVGQQEHVEQNVTVTKTGEYDSIALFVGGKGQLKIKILQNGREIATGIKELNTDVTGWENIKLKDDSNNAPVLKKGNNYLMQLSASKGEILLNLVKSEEAEQQIIKFINEEGTDKVKEQILEQKQVPIRFYNLVPYNRGIHTTNQSLWRLLIAIGTGILVAGFGFYAYTVWKKHSRSDVRNRAVKID
jgi:hypothetical protein